MSPLLLLLACTELPFSTTVEMRDGVLLATDFYLPPGDGPFPTILFRTPYGKTGDQWYAEGLNAAGIAVVAQDTRGRFQSEGVDGVFTTDGAGELQDGADTLAWIVDQDWSDGLVGMDGASAMGITQYLAASTGDQALVMINAEFATPNVYSDGFFQGGQRRWSLSHGWLEQQGSLFFEEEAAEHPYLDDFWDSVETRDKYGEARTPGLHVGGWYDIFAQGTLDAFVGYQHEGGEGAAGNQKLVMGPWSHVSPWATEQGELVYPDAAAAPPQSDLFDVMFNAWLGLDHPEIDALPEDRPAVQYYVMGDVDDPSAPATSGAAPRTGLSRRARSASTCSPAAAWPSTVLPKRAAALPSCPIRRIRRPPWAATTSTSRPVPTTSAQSRSATMSCSSRPTSSASRSRSPAGSGPTSSCSSTGPTPTWSCA